MRPQDLLSESEQAVDMSLDDSEFTICTESADVVEKHSYEVTARETCREEQTQRARRQAASSRPPSSMDHARTIGSGLLTAAHEIGP